MIKHLNIKIFGRVQGVGFRYFTKQKASKLGLTGFVQNQQDGSVYIEVEGPKDVVDKFADWCGQGSSWSRVEKIDVRQGEVQNFKDFVIQSD